MARSAGCQHKGLAPKTAMTTLGKLLFGGLVALLVVALVVMGVTIWWARTVVKTKQAEVDTERQVIKNQGIYSEGLMEELNVKAKEIEELRQECERLRMGRERGPEGLGESGSNNDGREDDAAGGTNRTP